MLNNVVTSRNNFATNECFFIQILVNFEIFKLSLYLSLRITGLRFSLVRSRLSDPCNA